MTHAFAIGKITGEPEFLRSGSPLDGWLYAGFEAAFERWGEDWRGVFRAGSAFAFLWGDFCGIVAPSRDSVGRDYPLAICAPIVGGTHPAVLLASRGFLENASALLRDARSTRMTRDELAWLLSGLRVPTDDDVRDAALEYEHWLRTTQAREGWAPMVPSGLLEVQMAKEGGVMRVPIGGGGAAAAALWLDVIERTIGRPGASFWSADEGTLAVWKNTPTSLIGSLWPGEPGGTWVTGTLAEVPSSGSMAEFITSLGEDE